MISFTPDGQPQVHFDLLGGDHLNNRKEVRMSLDEFLVLIRTTRTLEELKVSTIMYNIPRARSYVERRAARRVRAAGIGG